MNIAPVEIDRGHPAKPRNHHPPPGTVKRASVFLLVVALARTAFAGASDTVYVPGQTYFGRNQYIEYSAGDLPIIISVPHGGHEVPAEIPDRTWGDLSYDTNTQELARELIAALISRTGKHPHVIVNRLHRKKLDANREVVEAAQGNVSAIQAWEEFHVFIEAAKRAVTGSAGRGLYIDLHGHGHTIQRLELGYLLSPAQLALPDDSLNTPGLVNYSSVRNLVRAGGTSLSGLLRGPRSLGTFLENRGYPAVPGSMQVTPGSAAYFTGGYNTSRHGSRSGGTVDAIQIECNMTGVRDTETNYRRFAGILATVLDDFTQVHYSGRTIPIARMIINEVLFDVPEDDTATGRIEGDANGDGVRSVRGDEFVELFNNGTGTVNIGGYQILERNMRPVFTFPENTQLPPETFAVVFGGVGPGGFGPAFPAGIRLFAARPGQADSGFYYSPGKDNLLNSGENVVLYNPPVNEVLDEICWGAATPRTVQGKKLLMPNTWFGDSIAGPIAQSVTRSPDVTGLWARHRNVGRDSAAYSPGVAPGMLAQAGSVPGLPTSFALGQNYPNPFNPGTVIPFALPDRSHVELLLFDILGRPVLTLLNEDLPPGHYTVRLEAGHTLRLSSGMYYYRLLAGGRATTRTCTLLR